MSPLTVDTILASTFAQYQPIIDLTHNCMVACEALARWRDLDGTVTSIGPFIEEIESNEDHVLALTERMFTCIKADLGERLIKHPNFSVNINFSPVIIGKEKIMPMIERLGLTAHLPQITGEITERHALNDVGKNAIRLARQLGGKVAIDDFGTGLSGLQQLLGLEVDSIKIDRSFIRLLGKDLPAERLVRGIAALATILKVEIVAEGVETEDQASFLRAIGIDKGQGWLWSKAIGPEELQGWFVKNVP
ncbi:MAG: EAL domain-containing protein [Nitrospirales bacterium]